MIQTVIIEEETPSKLTLKLNDWLKGWSAEKIVDIKYVFKDAHYNTKPYSAMVIYKK